MLIEIPVDPSQVKNRISPTVFAENETGALGGLSASWR